MRGRREGEGGGACRGCLLGGMGEARTGVRGGVGGRGGAGLRRGGGRTRMKGPAWPGLKGAGPLSCRSQGGAGGAGVGGVRLVLASAGRNGNPEPRHVCLASTARSGVCLGWGGVRAEFFCFVSPWVEDCDAKGALWCGLRSCSGLLADLDTGIQSSVSPACRQGRRRSMVAAPCGWTMGGGT